MNNIIEHDSEWLLKILEGQEKASIGILSEQTSLSVETIIGFLTELELAGVINYISYDNKNYKNSIFKINTSYLDYHNLRLHKKTLETKKRVEKERIDRGYIEFSKYNINILRENLFKALKDIIGINSNKDIDLTFVDRNKFDADICIKITPLLRKYKGGGYITEIIPNLVKSLNNSDLIKTGIIKEVDVKGIYINIKLSDEYLFGLLKQVQDLGSRFGESDLNKGEAIVVDYSSPNTAKHLHAGHIRSTIIGHVLGNIYNSTGYFTHRINHINDWGGFGYLIEGYEKWKNQLPEFNLKNDMLYFIYTVYRLGEKASSSKEEFLKLDEDDILKLKKYYGDFSSFETMKKLFNNFSNKSKGKFSALEKGEKNEVELWEKMVDWSMEDFNRFYDILDIHQDYFVGESFYANMGRNLVKGLELDKKVVFYNQQLADLDLIKLDKEKGTIEEKVYETMKEEILRDIGCYLIKLPNFERFVVLKSDDSTIYATRDLAAIKYRAEIYNPSRIVYEVGQEQAEHFDKLFKSGKQIGINNIGFSHIYHGFYVDAFTKKKLSSRDGASNVQKLIEESIDYFRKKYDKNNKGFSKEEIEDIAYKLAIGSIIFNDIKKDKKNPVLISSDINEVCKTFESSGGAYIAYSICRANSIIKNYDKKIPNIKDTKGINLEPIEKTIILEINKFPFTLQLASSSDNPTIITEYLSNLARAYNSYYNSCKVLGGGNEYRIIITSLVSKILNNGMNICHIQIPNKI